MLVPHLNTILSAADAIHSRIGYEGGRLALSDFFEAVPGFLLVADDSVPESHCAVMIRRRGCVRIAYQPEAAKTRLRFAVAQQAGHALLHLGHLPEFALRPSVVLTPEIRVRQVKAFAAELLVPLWALEDALPGPVVAGMPYSKPSPAVVRGMALHFGVSQAVARIRIETYRQIRRTQAGRFGVQFEAVAE